MALLGVFIDGLSPEGVAHMPTLRALPHRRRLRTELGYSIACHASMYTGVHVDRHGLWFVWQRAQGAGVFPSWVPRLSRVPGLDTLAGHLAMNRVGSAWRARSGGARLGYFGVPRVRFLPLRHWGKLDVAERRFWLDSGYVPGYPTIFEHLAAQGRSVDVRGMSAYGGARRVEQTLTPPPRSAPPADFTLLFVGETDHLSHTAGQESPTARRRLGEIDATLARRIDELDNLVKGDLELVVWSDHGHIPVIGRVDLAARFRRAGLALAPLFHVIDANYARFWLERPEDEATIRRALSGVPEGELLTDEALARHRVLFPDRRFGDLIFLLRPGLVFHRTIWGLNRARSMHGYSPDVPGSDGVFLSSRPVCGDEAVKLVDLPPTLCARLGVPPLPHYEGRDRLVA